MLLEARTSYRVEIARHIAQPYGQVPVDRIFTQVERRERRHRGHRAHICDRDEFGGDRSAAAPRRRERGRTGHVQIAGDVVIPIEHNIYDALIREAAHHSARRIIARGSIGIGKTVHRARAAILAFTPVRDRGVKIARLVDVASARQTRT